MPNYTWKGRTRAGKTQEGVLVAENKDAVIALLRSVLRRTSNLGTLEP